MKKISLIHKITFLIFLFIIVSSFFVVIPISKKIGNQVREFTLSYVLKVKEVAGIDISYDSLSPSILSGFKIKDIVISDNEENIIVNVNKASIRYKLLGLFKGDFKEFIRGVNINGVKIDISELIEFFTENNELFYNPNTKKIDYTIITNFVPVNVDISDIEVFYKKNDFFTSLYLKEIELRNTRQTQSINFDFDCFAKIKFDNSNNPFSQITGNLFVNGYLTDNLENSSVFMSLVNFTDGTYTINKLNFLATCKNQNINIHTIQPVFPLAIDFNFDMNTLDFNANVNTKDLRLSSIFTTKGILNKNVSKAIKNTKLSINANASFNSEEKSFIYNSDGEMKIPSYFINDGAVLKYNLTGDGEHLDLQKMTVSGKSCDIDLSLDFFYKDLQLSGFANINDFTMKNSNKLSTELYFEPFEKGFAIYSPQIFIGEQIFTALEVNILPQEDSMDFVFEISDYTNVFGDQTTINDPGNIYLDGSYIFGTNYIQTGITFTNFYLYSILNTVKQLLPLDKANNFMSVINFSKPYVLAGEGYFSTDFNSISYNLPYFVFADSQKDNHAAFISLNGNETSIFLDKFNLILGEFAFDTTASVDFMPGTNDIFFILDVISSAVPYHFTGSFMSSILSISGDYGTSIEVLFNEDKTFEGIFLFDNFPLIFNNTTIISSLDSSFRYSEEQGPEFVINKFELEESDPNISINPRLSFIGSGTKYGAQLKSIVYSDVYSSLQGSSDITLNINNDIFDSLGIILSMESPFLEERINVDLSVTNPEQLLLNSDTVFNSLYMNGIIEISHFSLNRFTTVKNDNNELNASLYLSGTLEQPYVSVNVDKLSFLMANDLINCTGSAFLEGRELSINNIEINHPSWVVDDFTGNIQLDSMTANLNAVFQTIGAKNFVIPLNLTVKDSFIKKGSFIPESTQIVVSTEGIGGSIMKKPIPFSVNALYSSDYISFTSSENLGLIGNFSKSDGLAAVINCQDYFSFETTYTSNNNQILFKVNNIYANLNKIFSHFDIEEFLIIKKGIMRGNFSISDSFDSPNFKGAISISEPLVELPSLLKKDLSTDKILITANNNEFSIMEKIFKVNQKNVASIGVKMTLNKWLLDNLHLKCSTLKKSYIPLAIKTPILNFDGDVECDFSLDINNNTVLINGNLFGDNIDIVTDLQKITTASNENEQNYKNEPMNFKCDINVLLGTHVMLNCNPLLRTIFVPNTKVNLIIDTEQKLYKVDGELKLKSGDIAYLNRNFYVKNGSIKFNPQDIVNPLVTLTAETREKDQKGQSVRIILTAENQSLLNFNPRFSSIPPKSEAELQVLLGQIVIADSDDFKSLLLSAGDYYFQTMFVRDLENKLRDLLNFDIFSVRTNFIQNTINMGMSGNLSKEISIGNFFDNSTVYIGKYLGSALYVDAMLHLSIEKGNPMSTIGPIQLQPEFGLELDLPVVNIRWNMAPNITALLNKQYVPSTSVSLSWKFSF